MLRANLGLGRIVIIFLIVTTVGMPLMPVLAASKVNVTNAGTPENKSAFLLADTATDASDSNISQDQKQTIESSLPPIVPETSEQASGDGSEVPNAGNDFFAAKNPNKFAIGKNDQAQVVESTGAFSYNYSLDIPKGRNGLQPSLALTYNSQRNNKDSFYGLGWDLDSPFIERSGRQGTEKRYTNFDFVLSLPGGGNLLPLSVDQDGYGTYGVEVESQFYKIEWLTDKTWKVTDKTGTVYTFGSDSASRQNDQADAGKIYRWYLAEIRDTNDNFLRYEYWKDSGAIYPKAIYYTGNGTVDGPYRIIFDPIYSGPISTRPDISNSQEAGFSVTTKYAINTIQVLVNGVAKKKYDLETIAGEAGQTMISRVKEAGNNGSGWEYLPATDFDYGTSSKEWITDGNYQLPFRFESIDVSNVSQRGTFAFLPLDVNGDSLTDLLHSNQDCPENIYQKTYINNGVNGWATTSDWQLPFDFAFRYDTCSWPIWNYQSRFVVGDVNGDSREDFVVSYSVENVPVQQVYLNNGINGWTLATGWIVPLNFANYASSGSEQMVYTPEFIFTDINGDGLADFVESYRDDNAATHIQHVYLNNGINGWNLDTNWTVPVYFATYHASSNEISDRQSEYRVADVNGDGLPDLMYSQYDQAINTHQKAVYINNGKSGWDLDTSWIIPLDFSYYTTTQVLNDYGFRFKILDINADGLADFVESYHDYWQNNSDIKNVYINSGNGQWNIDTSYQIPFIFGEYTGDNKRLDYNSRFRLFDATGSLMPSYNTSYKTEYVYEEQENSVRTLNQPADWQKLRSIKRLDQTIVSADYAASAQLKDENQQLLNPRSIVNVPVVSEIDYNDGLGNQQTVNYSYEDGSYYVGSNIKQNRFVGFGKVTKAESDSLITTYYHQGGGLDGSAMGEYQDSYAKIGQPFRQEIRNASGQLLQQNVSKVNAVNLPDNRIFSFVERGTQTIFGTAAKSQATTYEYDALGNVTEEQNLGQVTANTGSGDIIDQLTGDEKTTTYAYATNSQKYIVGAPKTKVVSGIGETKDQDLYYDQLALGQIDRANVTKEDLKVNTVDIETTYDSFGLPLTKKDPKENTAVTLAYEPLHLFVSTTTDALGRVTVTEYDPVSGQLLYSRDPNGYQEKNTYDAFSRLIKKEVSDPANAANLITKQEIIYQDANFPNYKEVKDYFSTGHYVTSREYYDGLGRVIQSSRSDVSGQYVTSYTAYDSQDRVNRESLPVFTSSNAYNSSPSFTNAKVTTYDSLNRKLSEVILTGTTSYAYDGLTTTITDPRGKIKKLTNDAFGNLVKVEEFNSSSIYTTNYEYTLTNKLRKITDSQGNIRNFTYDALDNLTQQDMVHKASVSNPMHWTYTYDKNGNVLNKRDPKYQTTNYTYDALNRLLTENFTAQTGTEYTLTYDQGSGQLGRLTRVVGSDGLTTVYTYDPQGKPLTVTRMIDGNSYVLTYTYDWNGNVTSITYPEGERVDYLYNSAGQVSQVNKVKNSQTTVLAQNVTYSPMGQVAHLERGNGIVTDYTYDASQNYRLTRIHSVKGSRVLQDIAYIYDPNGNILTLIDTSATQLAKNVSYSYDDLNRLLSVTVTNSASNTNYTRSFTYDSIGNILSQTGVGDYTYTLNNPHQARTAGDKTLSYDNNGNVRFINSDTLNYDWRDRMTGSTLDGSADHTEYVYDHTNQRVKKHTIIYEAPPGGDPCDPSHEECPLPEQQSIVVPLEPTSEEEVNNPKVPDVELIDPNIDTLGGEVAAQSIKVEDGSAESDANITVDDQRLDVLLVTTDPVLPEFEPLATTTPDIIILPEPLATSTPEIIATSTDDIVLPPIDDTEATSTSDRLQIPIELNSIPASEDSATYYIDKYYEKEYSGAARNFYFLGNIKLATDVLNDPNTGIYYDLSDHLGSSSLTTDTSGQIIDTTDYYPYGTISYSNTTINIGDNHKYTGKELDGETNLSYFGARYYNQEIGRFNSIDTILFELGNEAQFKESAGRPLAIHLQNPQNLNSYAYSVNNPIRYVDPDGKIIPLILIAWGVVEVGLTMYDYYDTANTLANPNSSNSDKALSVGGVALGLALPGGGYGKGSKEGAGFVAKHADDLAKGATKGLNLTIDATKQAKHALGESYEVGKSIVTHTNPQKLINEFAGKGQKIFNQGKLWKETIDFGETIGKYIDDKTGKLFDTTRGTIHFSKTGTHLVPSKPFKLLK
ncbi:MAG: polymorphic toxin type 50 domain-containing protein [Candidatus Komeilibacteria bacterium]